MTEYLEGFGELYGEVDVSDISLEAMEYHKKYDLNHHTETDNQNWNAA